MTSQFNDIAYHSVPPQALVTTDAGTTGSSQTPSDGCSLIDVASDSESRDLALFPRDLFLSL
ncbi:uncharacterized protein ANIA_11656 [Aspergillus nidulans FGSC A4]|uniref:Uncharacterized protein n=1 Tax=Emericella nidulans (strain FGSC A4 / ATCC 38163 / CBS 112.46 / NRRL 194 / M139) TaxID=227321 RepID=C8VR39_EMENI|nr:hypothetical protein [Aspergillus nidulans FGSC A4]CBF87430.1 TPA: hypothetical protein ANIA_11656 [Aspergillus nidulans FGSC A4]